MPVVLLVGQAARLRLVASCRGVAARSFGCCSSLNARLNRGEEDPSQYIKGGFHPVRLGEILDNRYKIVSKLGYGVYSTVWLAERLKAQQTNGGDPQDGPSANRYAAIKILRADAHGGLKSTFELDILKHVRARFKHAPASRNASHLQDSFVHAGPNGEHLCLVTRVMGPSLEAVRQQLPRRQLPVEHCRQIARQILEALSFLHDDCGVIHTDLKPDNMLVELENIDEAIEHHLRRLEAVSANQASSSPFVMELPPAENIHVQLIDFGVASWRDKHLTDHIQPISLRAPEVFLGAPWDHKVDIWSLACVLYELHQGRVLFRGRAGPPGTHNAEEDQLAQMIELFGALPKSLLEHGRSTSEYFSENGEMLHIKHFHPCSFADLLAQTNNPSTRPSDYAKLQEFLESMLNFDPNSRPSAKELLGSRWLQS